MWRGRARGGGRKAGARAGGGAPPPARRSRIKISRALQQLQRRRRLRSGDQREGGREAADECGEEFARGGACRGSPSSALGARAQRALCTRAAGLPARGKPPPQPHGHPSPSTRVPAPGTAEFPEVGPRVPGSQAGVRGWQTRPKCPDLMDEEPPPPARSCQMQLRPRLGWGAGKENGRMRWEPSEGRGQRPSHPAARRTQGDARPCRLTRLAVNRSGLGQSPVVSELGVWSGVSPRWRPPMTQIPGVQRPVRGSQGVDRARQPPWLRITASITVITHQFTQSLLCANHMRGALPARPPQSRGVARTPF